MFVNAIMYYKVANAIHAVANVDDYSGSARQGSKDRAPSRLLCILFVILILFCPRLLAATTLRNVLGTMNLGEILSQRESIAREMRVSVRKMKRQNLETLIIIACVCLFDIQYRVPG